MVAEAPQTPATSLTSHEYTQPADAEPQRVDVAMHLDGMASA